MKEVLERGIKVISTYFDSMAKRAAKKIIYDLKQKVTNDTKLIIRKSLQ